GDGTNSAGQQTTFKNPATNTHTCPAGYDRYILGYAVEGQKLVDNLLVYCMRRHVPGGPEFFGLYGFGYDYGSAATYRNPSTGQASCPNGTSAHTVYGA